MQDLKHVFSYLKPTGGIYSLPSGWFCGMYFEMVIPMLMSDLVDQGVPSHDMQVIMLQGSKMIICAVLALITGLPVRQASLPAPQRLGRCSARS